LQRLRVPTPEGADAMRTGDFFRLRALGVFPNPVAGPGEGPTVDDVDMTEFVEFSSSDPNVIRVDGTRALAVASVGPRDRARSAYGHPVEPVAGR
jgi:hypothetical protein